jgi:hypothetical protein
MMAVAVAKRLNMATPLVDAFTEAIQFITTLACVVSVTGETKRTPTEADALFCVQHTISELYRRLQRLLPGGVVS